MRQANLTGSPDATPPVTVLIATVRGWPDARPAVERVAHEVAATGGEFIVVDGSARPAPSQAELADLAAPVLWLARPGESVFQLRRHGYRAARGQIIAVTEDHVVVSPGWLAAHVAAHARFPSAGAIGGGMLNGTNRRALDWAAFFLTQGPFMPPFPGGPAKRVCAPANVSYKRRVIARLGGDEEHGLIDFLELPHALAGEDMVADDSITALHHQTGSLAKLSLAEFDNGRSIAGYRRRDMTRGDWLRLLTAPLLPLYRSVRQLRIVAGRRYPPGMLARAAPAHVWFQYCAMAGEVAGYLAGPGGSPRRLY